MLNTRSIRQEEDIWELTAGMFGKFNSVTFWTGGRYASAKSRDALAFLVSYKSLVVASQLHQLRVEKLSLWYSPLQEWEGIPETLTTLPLY